jgi:hypothetical protein
LCACLFHSLCHRSSRIEMSLSHQHRCGSEHLLQEGC